ncbi:hypothetical protein N9C29_00290 [Saprospiraceae bacterium]|nr:hypothetical protein [Saprospiraceae bacterium]MDA9333237.1 hypothetical protein [Saprospiraceae bacterium]MDA9866241.1 hypothetical protein [Saprospiraceae bacterium]MDC1305354.1 hypothetical protein [Saprospiraceae bacterium]
MKILNNLSVLFAGIIAITMVGCVGSDFEGTEFPGNEFTVEGTAISALGVSGDFDIGKADVQSVNYTVNARGGAISGVEVRITHPNGSAGSLGTSTAFPDVKSVSLNDALTATGMAIDDVAVGDMWLVEYLVDGNPTTTSFSINTVTTFKSALAGLCSGKATVTAQGGAAATWDGNAGMVWEGPVTFVRQQLNPNDDGEYVISTQNGAADPLDDISFGAYYAGYATDAQGSLPNGDLRLRDIDNKLSITGASQWGEVFSIENIVVDGATLSFKWTNDYGEGAEIVLTRDDGEDWPPLN